MTFCDGVRLRSCFWELPGGKLPHWRPSIPGRRSSKIAFDSSFFQNPILFPSPPSSSLYRKLNAGIAFNVMRPYNLGLWLTGVRIWARQIQERLPYYHRKQLQHSPCHPHPDSQSPGQWRNSEESAERMSWYKIRWISIFCAKGKGAIKKEIKSM